MIWLFKIGTAFIFWWFGEKPIFEYIEYGLYEMGMTGGGTPTMLDVKPQFEKPKLPRWSQKSSMQIWKLSKTKGEKFSIRHALMC